jgi:hypothetical protein
MAGVESDPLAGRRRALLPRAALLLVAAAQAEIAAWGLVGPRSFYHGYPGAGHHWVAALGPYNEHLVRDFAGCELGLAVMLTAAAVWFERRLVVAAATAFLAAELPHFAYHLTTTNHLSGGDNAATLTGFVVELALVSAAALRAVQHRPPGGSLSGIPQAP